MATNATETAKEAVSNIMDRAAAPAFSLVDRATNYVISNSDKLAGSIIVLIIGVFAARWAGKVILRGLEKKDLEPPIRMLIVRISRVVIFGLALMVALQTLGFNMTALIAGLGVAGVGVGFALQGVLGNLFAGLTIIFTKPFRVGEYISIVGVEGVVSQIELITTTLVHADASRVVIPNRKIIGEILHNYGAVRQLSLNVGVGYGSDLNKVRTVVSEVLKNNPRVLRDPAPVIAVSAFNDSSISIAIMPWVKTADFGPAQTEINQAILERFRASQIEIPFPQSEIRILNNPAALRA